MNEVLETSIFLSSAYEGGKPALSLIVSSSHQQYVFSVLIVAELVRVTEGREMSHWHCTGFEPLTSQQLKILTTGVSHTPPI